MTARAEEEALAGSLADGTGLKRRIPALDGLRGVAIALVLAVHFVRAPDHLLGGLVNRLAGAGWIGVDLFFVLSGFLITGILVDRKGERTYYRAFYFRRMARTLPLYYGLLAVILLLPRAGFAAELLGAPYLAEHQTWFWTHTVNWLMVSEGETQLAVQHGFGALWSLAIEEQFYLVWPIVIAMVSLRNLSRVIIGIALSSAALRLYLAFSGTPEFVLYSATLTRLDPLAIGALLAVLARAGGLARIRAGYSWFVVLVAIVIAGLIVIGQSTPHANAIAFAASSAGLAIGWGAVLLLTLLGKPWRWITILEHPLLRSFGKYSYAIYLFQAPVDHVLTRSGFGPEVIGGIGYLIAGVGLTFSLAFASWHLWEKHWLGLKVRFPRTASEALPVT